MEWFTEVPVEKSPWLIGHGEPVMTIGSCFSDSVGVRLRRRLFDVEVNPLGTLYNPLSIADALERAISGRRYSESDLIQSDGMHHCLDFHSSFSHPEAADTLAAINGAIERVHDRLPSLRVLALTFGSARAFVHNSTGRVAGNCHKLPPSEFKVTDIEPDIIVGRYVPLLETLRRISPALHVIITVSPIRHKAYGFHADRLSKARLLLASDRICALAGASYFPAYEIMNDELRDYRFYASDMTHPSETAVDHIFSRFACTYFSDATATLALRALKLTRRLDHRPLGPPESAAHAHFVAATAEMARELVREHPELTAALRRLPLTPPSTSTLNITRQ